MLEDSETEKPGPDGPGTQPLEPPAPRGWSLAAQVAQAALLGWWASTFLQLPTPWADGELLVLAFGIWLGDPNRARFPSIMLVAFAAGAAWKLRLPMVDRAAWSGWGSSNDVIHSVLMPVGLAMTGYGSTRLPRRFFAGRPPVMWARRCLLVALGASLGFQLTGLWRLGSRLGLGTPEDSIMFAVVSAGLIAVGGLAFGRLFKRTSELHVAAALSASSALAFAALAIVGGVSTPRGFRALCERFGTDASLAGTAVTDAAVAGSIGMLPLFALGAAIHLARDRGALAAVVLGLGLGPLAAQAALPKAFDSIAEAALALGSAGLPKYGAIAAGLCLVLMALTCDRKRRVLAAGLALSAAGAVIPVSPIRILPPWERFPRQAETLFETAAGQFTIQLDGNPSGNPDGNQSRRILLDQRSLTPTADEHGLDRAAIVESFRRWQENGHPARTSGRTRVPERVLVLGLVTPARAQTLADLGITLMDCATTFPGMAPALTELLFEGSGAEPPKIRYVQGYMDPWRLPGPEEASHDLTIAFVPGAHASLDWRAGSLLAKAGGHGPHATCVDPDRPLAGLEFGPAAFAADGLRAIAAFAQPSPRHVDRTGRPQLQPVAGPGPSILDWLQTRPGERQRSALREILQRASFTVDHRLFHRGFVEFAKIQRVGSPFESPDERVVLNERALSLWREFAIAQPWRERHERSMLEGAADALRAQGEIEWILEFLEPIAEAHTPWPKLDRTVQWAREQSQPAGRLALIRIMPQLTQLAAQAEGATIGVITGIEVRQVDPGDGAPLLMTGLMVRGTDLATGAPGEVQVWYPGGVIDENTGSFTADSPRRHQTRIGRGAIVFHRHSGNMGGGLSGHVLVGGAGGLLNTFQTSDSETLVLPAGVPSGVRRRARSGVPRNGQDRASGGNISAEELRSRFQALSGPPPNPPR